ncbi:unnamed protein product [Trichobilharzia regenti]|nr:unnamed protein product [Trichobilharzia regenti]
MLTDGKRLIAVLCIFVHRSNSEYAFCPIQDDLVEDVIRLEPSSTLFVRQLEMKQRPTSFMDPLNIYSSLFPMNTNLANHHSNIGNVNVSTSCSSSLSNSSLSIEICELIEALLNTLLGSQSELKHKLNDLLKTFQQLQLDHKEFTCLKFIVLFNPSKHGEYFRFLLILLPF